MNRQETVLLHKETIAIWSQLMDALYFGQKNKFSHHFKIVFAVLACIRFYVENLIFE